MDEDEEDKPKKGGGRKKPQAADYQKLDQIEHALKRPDMYIGNATPISQKMWVYDKGMVYRDITYVPGLYKIFDEILVNAADNAQRDPDMKYIKVTIDRDAGEITVTNDGDGKL
jgi:DNA topoisomerase-2